MADFSALEIPDDFEYSAEVAHRPRDFKMAWFLGKICNVVTIPMTAFVSDEHAHLYEQYLRFSFCKDGGEIEEATKRLEKVSALLWCDCMRVVADAFHGSRAASSLHEAEVKISS